jgi:hypothetical protein
VQRCQAQPRIFARAAFSPACASEIANWMPTRPHLTSPRRKSILGLGLADVDAQYFAPAGLVHAVSDHQGLVDHAANVTDLLDLRIEKDIGVGAPQRPRPERLHVLVERAADPADLALAHP